MNKRFVSFICALGIAGGAAVSCVYAVNTVEAQEELKPYESTVTPSEDTEERVLKIQNVRERSLTVSETNENADTKPLTGFYQYGTDYARRYFAETENAEAKLAFYDELLNKCVEIAGLETDIPLETFYFDNDREEQHPLYAKIVTDLDYFDIYTVYFLFRNDHPEFFWLSNYLLINTWTDDYGNIEVSANVCVYDEYAGAEARNSTALKIEENFKKALSEVEGMESDYDTVKAVHDYLCGVVEYGWVRDENGNKTDVALNTPNAHNITAVFDGDPSTDGVCESYAKSFQLLLNALRIDNIYVFGYAGGEHAWNMAKLDGAYYYFDVTWDDQDPISYRYFAGGTKTFADHTLSNPDTEYYNNFLYSVPEVGENGYVKPYNSEYTFSLKSAMGQFANDDNASRLSAIKIEIVKDGEALTYGTDYMLYDEDGNPVDSAAFGDYFTEGNTFHPQEASEMIDLINKYSMGVKVGTRITFTPIYKKDGVGYVMGSTSAVVEAKEANTTPKPNPTAAPTDAPGVSAEIEAVDSETKTVTITVEGDPEKLFATSVVYDENGAMIGLEIIELKAGTESYSINAVPDKLFIWENMKPVCSLVRERTAE